MPKQPTITAAVRRKLKSIERHKREAARLIDEVEQDLGIDKIVDKDTWYWGSHVDEQRTMGVAEMEKLLERFLLLKGTKARSESDEMAKSNPLKQVEARLRKKALSYPETKEEFPWEHRAIKVKGKIFLILAMHEKKLGVTMKLPDSGNSALALPFTESTGYGLGKSGWVTSRFGPVDMVPVDVLMEWLDESYRAIAPKKVVAQLDSKAKTKSPKRARSTTK